MFSLTVAIPTLNRPESLGRAIESLLKQSYENLEIIVADNASTEDLRPLKTRYAGTGIRWFRHDENIGMVGNWNFCLEQARGDLFLMLSDDDLLMPGALSWLSYQFNDDNVLLAHVRCLLVDGLMRPLKLAALCPEKETGDSYIRGFLDRKRPTFPSAVMFRTMDAHKVGGYPKIGTATDFALHMLVASKGQVVYNPEPLCHYCVHPQALSNSSAALETIHSLIEWSDQSESIQYLYRKEVYEYCVKFIFWWGVARFSMGAVQDLRLALEHLSRYPHETMKKFVLTCLDGLLPRTLIELVWFMKGIKK